VVVDDDAIAGLKVAVVAWLSALVISFVFVFIVFIDDLCRLKKKKKKIPGNR
jgi:UDP-N-acetylmuramyl pentapeptide phosphotransferase/UDP-N-acetylglucosamine-1-phosphate transferase